MDVNSINILIKTLRFLGWIKKKKKTAIHLLLPRHTPHYKDKDLKCKRIEKYEPCKHKPK